MELGATKWLLTFGTPGQEATVRREISAGEPSALLAVLPTVLDWARRRLGLSAECAVFSCYEAGRDGFFPHRLLTALGVANIVIDSASIQVDRRKKRAKTDRIDGAKLLVLLLRHLRADQKLDRLTVAQVPTLQQEMNRQRDREIQALKKDQQRHRNRTKSLLALMGIRLPGQRKVEQALAAKCWDGQALPKELAERIGREQERLSVARRQIAELERAREAETKVRKAARKAAATAAAKAKEQARAEAELADPHVVRIRRQLEHLVSVGASTSSVLTNELFGWREFANVRQLGSCAGLAPAPWQSGSTQRDQGITKAGNRLVRWSMTQLAHRWLRHQADSELSTWWQTRFGKGSSATRKVGIVALARKLLVALWKYLKTGEAPAGALLKPG